MAFLRNRYFLASFHPLMLSQHAPVSPTISYRNDGSIISSNQLYNQEINEVLNLNIGMLKVNRKAVRRKLIDTLGKKEWKKGDIEKILKVYREKDSSGRKKEYCGVVVDYLTKKLRNIP